MLTKKDRSFVLTVVLMALGAIALLIFLWFGLFERYDNSLELLYKSGFFISFAITGISFFVFRKTLLLRPEKIFLIGLLSLSCFSSWAYDTNEVSWDVESHYRFVLEYADADGEYEPSRADLSIIDRALYADPDDERMRILGDSYAEPGNAITFANITIWTDTHSLKIKDDLLNEIAAEEREDNRTFSGRLANLYSRIASLPATLVMALSSLFGFPFVICFILAKMTNALIYSFVMYFGMRKLRSGKLIFAVLALYPTAVFLASNFSYDFWVNAWLMYSVACIVGILQHPGRKMSTRGCVKILVAFFIGLGPKAIYFPLIAICFFIPRARFLTKKACWTFRAAAIVCMLIVLVSFALPFLVSSGSNIADTRGSSEVNPLGQIKYILSNFPSYMAMIIGFAFDFLSISNAKNYIANLAYLGKGENIIWLSFLLLSIFTAITDTRFSTKAVNNYRTRIGAILASILALGLAMTALYIAFNAVGASSIAGFQGRYIFPLLFPFLIFMGSKKCWWPRSIRGLTIYNSIILGLLLVLDYAQLWISYVGLLN